MGALRGHALGGSRRLNGHWQSAESLWDWILQTKNYIRENPDSSPHSIDGKFNDTHVIKTRRILPSDIIGENTSGGWEAASWFKVEVDCDYNTTLTGEVDHIFNSNAPTDLYDKFAINPIIDDVWTTYLGFFGYLSVNDDVTPGMLVIAQGDSMSAMTIDKTQSYIMVTRSRAEFGQHLVFYTTPGPSISTPNDGRPVDDFSYGVYAKEKQPGNSNPGYPDNYNCTIKIKRVPWSVVRQNGLFLDTRPTPT